MFKDIHRSKYNVEIIQISLEIYQRHQIRQQNVIDSELNFSTTQDNDKTIKELYKVNG